MTDYRTRLDELKTDLSLLLEKYVDVVDFKTNAETHGATGFSEPPSTEEIAHMRPNGWVLAVESFNIENQASAVITVSPSMQSDAHTEGILRQGC